MHKTNRLFHGRRWIALFAVMTLLAISFCLPLQAATLRGRDDQGIMGDMRDGIRRFGRDVSDALDPDSSAPDDGTVGDGLNPDGSIDDGMADDGSQNTPDDGGILPGVTSEGNGATTTPDTPAETGDDSTPGTDDANRTEQVAPGTTAPTTTNAAETGDNAQVDGNTGFRWTGLIIALVIAAAVVIVIILLVSKKKD